MNGNLIRESIAIAKVLPIRIKIDSPTERAVLLVMVDRKNDIVPINSTGINIINVLFKVFIINDCFTTWVPTRARSLAKRFLKPNAKPHVVNVAVYAISPNIIVSATIARNLDSNILNLLFGLITSSLIVPLENSLDTIVPAITTMIRLITDMSELIMSLKVSLALLEYWMLFLKA